MVNPGLPVPLDRILEEARLKSAIALEHLADLSNFGITEEWLKQIQEDLETVENIATFDLQKTELKTLTAIKDEKLAKCVQWGRKLRLRMSLAIADDKLKGVEFPNKTWVASEKNESKLITFMPTLINLAKTHAQVLETVGQKTEEIATGESLLKELTAANQTQEEYNIKRKGVTVERQTIYRRLYDSVNRINRVGQMVFNNNPAVSRLFSSSWSQGTSKGTTQETTTN
jgi:hypothetical protein